MPIITSIHDMLCVGQNVASGIACRCRSRGQSTEIDLLQIPVTGAVIPRIPDDSGGVAVSNMRLVVVDKSERVAHCCGSRCQSTEIDLLQIPVTGAVIPRIPDDSGGVAVNNM